MKPTFYKLTGKYQIIIPPSITGTGKRQRKFFDTKAEAEAAIRGLKRDGYNPTKDLDSDDLAVLRLLKNRYPRSADLFSRLDLVDKILDAVPEEKRVTLHQACLDYMEHHEHEKSHPVTKRKYRSTLRRFSADLEGHALPLLQVTKDQVINIYLKRFGPGVTRMAQWSNLRAFFNWAVENQYLATNPIGDTKPLDKWASNKEILPVEDFRGILLACAQKFPRLLPYFVLGGLAGVRRAEMISSEPADRDPRIEWTDIDFKLNKIRIRDDVAKQTNAVDRRRSIPLESAAREWLQLVAKTEGPVIAISQSQLQRDKAELLDMLKLKVPENALRNSYASYGCAFRSIGDVARAMGDLEVTIKRYYVDLVDDPELGRAWFDIRPGGARKIVPMKEVA